MTYIMPRGNKLIEAICPCCFRSFTKLGSMHRHIYEDRCRTPQQAFVKKIKAEHNARVKRSAARAAARAAAPRLPAEQQKRPEGAAREVSRGNVREQCPIAFQCGCGAQFTQGNSLEMHQNGGYCTKWQTQITYPQDFSFNNFNTDWLTFDSFWTQV